MTLSPPPLPRSLVKGRRLGGSITTKEIRRSVDPDVRNRPGSGEDMVGLVSAPPPPHRRRGDVLWQARVRGGGGSGSVPDPGPRGVGRGVQRGGGGLGSGPARTPPPRPPAPARVRQSPCPQGVLPPPCRPLHSRRRQPLLSVSHRWCATIQGSLPLRVRVVRVVCCRFGGGGLSRRPHPHTCGLGIGDGTWAVSRARGWAGLSCTGGGGRNRVCDANRNERPRGRSLLHGQRHGQGTIPYKQY